MTSARCPKKFFNTSIHSLNLLSACAIMISYFLDANFPAKLPLCFSKKHTSLLASFWLIFDFLNQPGIIKFSQGPFYLKYGTRMDSVSRTTWRLVTIPSSSCHFLFQMFHYQIISICSKFSGVYVSSFYF